MARPRKEGLDYFPLSVHFDEKIKALELLHKNDGLVWIIKFWQNAYQTNSGEVNLKGLFGVIQAENCRITIVKQAEIIRDCLELGLITMINDDMYTSNGIQKRLNEIVKDREFERKRKLVDSFPAENAPLIGESKVKESKVNEKKIKEQSVSNKDSIQAVFVKGFSNIYQEVTGMPYMANKEDFIIASKLIKNFTLDVVKLKTEILLDLCKNKSKWFTKEGLSSFNIKTLSKHWSSILKEERKLELV